MEESCLTEVTRESITHIYVLMNEYALAVSSKEGVGKTKYNSGKNKQWKRENLEDWIHMK